MGKPRGWSISVECPHCRDKFKVTKTKLFLDPSPRNDSILVPFAECPLCEYDVEIKGVPTEIIATIQGMI